MIFSDTASAVMQKYLLISHRCCYHCGLLLMVHNGSTKFQLEVSKKKKKMPFYPSPNSWVPWTGSMHLQQGGLWTQMTCLRSLPCVHGSQRSAGWAPASRQQGPPRQLRNSPVLPNKMQQKTLASSIIINSYKCINRFPHSIPHHWPEKNSHETTEALAGHQESLPLPWAEASHSWPPLGHSQQQEEGGAEGKMVSAPGSLSPGRRR